MASHLPLPPLNDLNGLNPPPSHRSSGNQLLWNSEVASVVNFQPLTDQHPQHGYEGQLDQEQLVTPRVPLQPQVPFQHQGIQNTHHDQVWFEQKEEEVLQRFRDSHDHESQARFEDNETQVGRDEARLFRPIAQIQDYRDEQLDEDQELQGPQEMLAQLDEQMEQGGFGQQRDGTSPSLPTDFVHQRSQDLQGYQSPYDAHNLNAASSQGYFQQQPDQHGRQLTYQETQCDDQDRRQNEAQQIQMGSSHAEGHQRKVQPSDDDLALPQRGHDSSHLPPSCVDPPLVWPHLENEGSNFDSLPDQLPYNYTDQQVQQSSWVDPVPSSPPGMDFALWRFLPRQTTYHHSNQQGQQSMAISQPQQAAYAQHPIWPSTPLDNQWATTPEPSSPYGTNFDTVSPSDLLVQQTAYDHQPIRDSTSPRIQSRTATPIPSNPPGMDLDPMDPYRLRMGNQAFNLPFDRNRGNMINKAKTGKPKHMIKKSKRSQKKRNLEGSTAGYAAGAPPQTGSGAASRHCSTCTCTQVFSVSHAYDLPSEPNMPPVRNSRKRRMHENSAQQPNLRRSKRETAYKGHL